MTDANEKELIAFLVLNRLGIEGRRRTVALLAEGKTAYETFEQIAAEDLFRKDLEGSLDPAKELESCRQKGIGLLCYSDPDYPGSLKEIPDPPLLLYRKGVIIESDRNALAIVGTRHPSFYGRTQAQRFSQDLAGKGLTIVSGLARGIDQVAHEAALKVSHGRTIAVMGCGLDVVYPKESAGLCERIADRGAVLSEYPLGTPPLPENFPRRNRILSGLSYATLVVEAHSRSGSIITAHQALEQGREVFALPGPVDQLTSHGTHQLIKEGACLVESPEDIFDALAPRLKTENNFSLTPPADVVLVDGVKNLVLRFFGASKKNEPRDSFAGKISSIPEPGEQGVPLPVEISAVLANGGSSPREEQDIPISEDAKTVEEILREEGPLAQEEILEFTGLEPSRLPGILLQLELAGKVRRSPGGTYNPR
ncbi:MAG TPA: DNA-processing protein DprA [Candidatus Omnitrophota bacterium]|nr:DNA-processing protein DprA [Candidatus Omnitrophota bacterium]HPS36137.1 DNA-processing protein DprA [Candidatus Omnitrophota bacterium]